MKYLRNSTFYTKKIKNKWYILENNKKIMRELNEVGSLIWEMLAKPCTTEHLAHRVCREYNIESKIAEKDIQKFISSYIKEGYIIKMNEH